MKVVAVIPARFASTRFPGKPLVLIDGVEMVVHVARRAALARSVDRIIVATDHDAVRDVATRAGFDAVMTRADHPSGTDRVAEAALPLDVDLVVNVQGDEPLLDPEHIDAAVAPFASDAALQMGSLKTPLRDAADLWNPNCAKVVADANDFAIYFSRSPIPFVRDAMDGEPVREWRPEFDGMFFKHIGLYVYRKEFLRRFTAMPPSRLEQIEKLEQLRAIEAGIRIKVPTVESDSWGVDTPADLERMRDRVGGRKE
ncbi:MAG: 3-deoxy-manno-octulosonate cytidylyltransferase [Deltaproteobacteria bacterium]|nr:3-deoxy-manno-octulosonate cytidylyltransferase [Deltaproteobacteria bacterium]